MHNAVILLHAGRVTVNDYLTTSTVWNLSTTQHLRLNERPPPIGGISTGRHRPAHIPATSTAMTKTSSRPRGPWGAATTYGIVQRRDRSTPRSPATWDRPRCLPCGLLVIVGHRCYDQIREPGRRFRRGQTQVQRGRSRLHRRDQDRDRRRRRGLTPPDRERVSITPGSLSGGGNDRIKVVFRPTMSARRRCDDLASSAHTGPLIGVLSADRIVVSGCDLPHRRLHRLDSTRGPVGIMGRVGRRSNLPRSVKT